MHILHTKHSLSALIRRTGAAKPSVATAVARGRSAGMPNASAARLKFGDSFDINPDWVDPATIHRIEKHYPSYRTIEDPYTNGLKIYTDNSDQTQDVFDYLYRDLDLYPDTDFTESSDNY